MQEQTGHQRIQFGLRKRIANFGVCIVAGVFRIVAFFTPRSEESRTVTLLEPYGLGDVITLEPLIRNLKAAGFRVVLVAKESWSRLYPEDAQLTFLPANIPWSTYQENSKYSAARFASAEFRSFLKQSRIASRGSIGVDTRGDIRSVLLLYLAGCRVVYTLDNYLGSTLRIPAFAARVVRFQDDLTRWQMNLEFCKPLNLPAPANAPQFPHLTDPRVKDKTIVFVPVAPWEGKLWSPDKWQSLASRLVAEGFYVRALCGPNQGAETLAQTGPAVPVVVCNSIDAWAAELQKAEAVVSLDSGPMHLAAALDVKVVGLFGQGKLPLWSPGTRQSKIISHQEDRDFVLLQPVEQSTEDARQRMKRITVEEVLAALKDFLKNQP